MKKSTKHLPRESLGDSYNSATTTTTNQQPTTFFLHYGWFFQNLGKEAVRTFMHTTVCTAINAIHFFTDYCICILHKGYVISLAKVALGTKKKVFYVNRVGQKLAGNAKMILNTCFINYLHKLIFSTVSTPQPL